MLQMVMGSADGKDAHRNHLPYIDFKLLHSCLAKARISQRTMELSFCCERWVNQVDPPALCIKHNPGDMVTQSDAMLSLW